jgi:hypothetical protein
MHVELSDVASMRAKISSAFPASVRARAAGPHSNAEASTVGDWQQAPHPGGQLRPDALPKSAVRRSRSRYISRRDSEGGAGGGGGGGEGDDSEGVEELDNARSPSRRLRGAILLLDAPMLWGDETSALIGMRTV